MYRELSIKEVKVSRKGLSISFNNSVVNIDVSKKWLRERGGKWQQFIAGRTILVKGKIGCDDSSLLGIDVIENIIIVPLIKK